MNIDLNQDIARVIKYINKLDKLKLNKVLVDILDLKENISLYSEFHFIQEFNKFLVEKQLIQKENQINFCLFFSYLTKNIEETCPFIETINQETYLKGNERKLNLITNIDDNKKDGKYKVDIKNLFLVEKNPTIQTSFLNKKKFNTIKFFTHILTNYRYEFKLTKTTVKNLLYIFYICHTRVRDKTIKKTDEDIKDYFDKIIEFLETYYKTLKS